MNTTIRIATRRSQLAIAQSESVAAQLQALGFATELLALSTRGDETLDRALTEIGGKGLFVSELESALKSGAAHLAVHSLKDVPAHLPEGFALAAILEREDARDVWVSKRFENLQAANYGAKIGSASLRRQAQLLSLRPDLQITLLRGNLQTRLRKLFEGECDALVLAAAGLKRLGLSENIRTVFAIETLLPAAGQGALALEIVAPNALPRGLAEALQKLNHALTQSAVSAERALVRKLGGDCGMPLAAHAHWQGSDLCLQAQLYLADGQTLRAHSRRTMASINPTAIESLGAEAAEQLQTQRHDRALFARAA